MGLLGHTTSQQSPVTRRRLSCEKEDKHSTPVVLDIGRDPFNQNSDRSDREKRTTSKGGPVFSNLFRLDRTDPLSFGPKFPEILVEWIAPIHVHACGRGACVTPARSHRAAAKKTTKPPPWSMLHNDVVIVLTHCVTFSGDTRVLTLERKLKPLTAGIKPIAKAAV